MLNSLLAQLKLLLPSQIQVMEIIHGKFYKPYRIKSPYKKALLHSGRISSVCRRALFRFCNQSDYSNSMVPGGLEVMSYTTRFT